MKMIMRYSVKPSNYECLSIGKYMGKTLVKISVKLER